MNSAPRQGLLLPPLNIRPADVCKLQEAVTGAHLLDQGSIVSVMKSASNKGYIDGMAFTGQSTGELPPSPHSHEEARR